MSTNDGGPAFPIDTAWSSDGQAISAGCPGMSLRDYFAARAIPAIVAAYVEANGRCIGTEHFPPNTAAHAYRVADAMLKVRSA